MILLFGNFISTDLIMLSLPWSTFVTLLWSQCEHGNWLSLIKTKLFSLKFRWLVSHFWRCHSDGTYSLTKRFQNKFTSLCIDFHFDLYSCGDVLNIPGEWLWNFLIQKLFGVNASFELLLQGKSGLLLRMHSIWQSVGISDSLWYVLSFITVFMPLLDNMTRDSHDPPIHGLTARSNFQTIPQFDISIWIFDWLRFWSAFHSFQSAPTTFVSLSLSVSFGLPGQAMKDLKANINISMAKSLASSKWTAGVVRQVNKAPYCLCIAWFNLVFCIGFTLIGPNYSVLVCVNSSLYESLSVWRSDIIGALGLIFCRLQKKQFWIIDLASLSRIYLDLMIKYVFFHCVIFLNASLTKLICLEWTIFIWERF